VITSVVGRYLTQPTQATTATKAILGVRMLDLTIFTREVSHSRRGGSLCITPVTLEDFIYRLKSEKRYI
jgi:hypothetical protein